MQPLRLLMAAVPVIYSLFAYFVSRLFPDAIIITAWVIIAISFAMPYILKQAAGIKLYGNDAFGSLGFMLFGWCGTDWVLYNFLSNAKSLRDQPDLTFFPFIIVGVITTLALVWEIYTNEAFKPAKS